MNRNRWQYESDGNVGHRTHYAWRWEDDGVNDVERIDFVNAKEAREYVARQNDLLANLEAAA